jgi:hypothetical protein
MAVLLADVVEANHGVLIERFSAEVKPQAVAPG